MSPIFPPWALEEGEDLHTLRSYSLRAKLKEKKVEHCFHVFLKL